MRAIACSWPTLHAVYIQYIMGPIYPVCVQCKIDWMQYATCKMDSCRSSKRSFTRVCDQRAVSIRTAEAAGSGSPILGGDVTLSGSDIEMTRSEEGEGSGDEDEL